MSKGIYVSPSGPPSAQPSREIYGVMGQDNIFAMLRDFYVELEKSPIRGLFPEDMIKSSEKSAAFFVGLLGGPPLYQQRYGDPMLRQRHLPFRIDKAARDTWIACFDHVLEEAPVKYNFPAEHLAGFQQFLRGFSLWMINTPDEETGA